MTASDTLLSNDVRLNSPFPKPGAGHQRLNAFVGTWNTEGQQGEGAVGPALAERIVGIETTDKLTDPQIVAKVKEHYGIDR